MKTQKEVLLIGENRELVFLIGRLLERYGYCVQITVGVREAMKAFRNRTPGLIVMDCDLPDGDGIEVVHLLRKKNSKVKILMVSGNEEYEVAALKAGADDFIKKPYHMDVMLARMDRLCSCRPTPFGLLRCKACVFTLSFEG